MYKTMKTHIELGQLIEPTAEQILTLNNHKFRDVIWVQWDKTDHIQEALDVFKEKGGDIVPYLKQQNYAIQQI
ncbi:hypothetical protein [Bacillus sp. N447-1]|uniref:hypothetical protein n=1 Tax=Bacillus sp. N447-1 TaxID=2789208 RepID=UPI001F6073B8|nr:hypothetical protein [Bacillus sp. N447-1]